MVITVRRNFLMIAEALFFKARLEGAPLAQLGPEED
jgi:hypothetical protein